MQPAANPDGFPRRRSSGAAAALVSALIAIALYGVTLGGTYIYDDVTIAHEDPRVLNPGQFYQLWTKPYSVTSVDKLYRPLVSSSFAVENCLHGDRPWAFHAVNIALHAIVSALVALLGARLAGLRAAWISGVLFAVHPVHVEAVAGLVGRAESACALAQLGALLVFLSPRKLDGVRIGWIAACFASGLLCKEQGILLPILMLFAYPLRGGWQEPNQRKYLKLLAISLCWICAGYLFLRERVASLSWDRSHLDWYVNPMILSTGRDRVLMPLVVLGRYSRLLIFPTTLSLDYGGKIIGSVARLNDPYLYAGILAVLLWAVMLLIAWRRRLVALVFCLLSLALCYGVIGNVIALIGTIFGERLMYLPSIFFAVLVGMGGAAIRREVAISLLVVITAAASVRTFSYARRWNDPGDLYSYNLATHPDSERSAILMADFYIHRHDWGHSLIVAEELGRRSPERWEPYVFQIQALVGAGQYDQAVAVADEGIGHVPRDARIILIEWREFILRNRDAAKH